MANNERKLNLNVIYIFEWHYDNAYKDFAYKNFSYNIKKYIISWMFLFTVISNVIYK